MESVVGSQIDGFEVLFLEDDNEFILLCDDIGGVRVFDQRGRLVDSFIHLLATNFGKEYEKGVYIVRFVSQEKTYERVVSK